MSPNQLFRNFLKKCTTNGKELFHHHLKFGDFESPGSCYLLGMSMGTVQRLRDFQGKGWDSVGASSSHAYWELLWLVE